MARELARLGFVLPGTLLHRSYRCGRPACRCTADPPRLPRPTSSWTPQATAKTRPPRPRGCRAGRLPALVRQRPPAPGAGHRAGDPHAERCRPGPPLVTGTPTPGQAARGTRNDEGDDHMPPRPVTSTIRPVTKS